MKYLSPPGQTNPELPKRSGGRLLRKLFKSHELIGLLVSEDDSTPLVAESVDELPADVAIINDLRSCNKRNCSALRQAERLLRFKKRGLRSKCIMS